MTANAHSVLATFCGLNEPADLSAALESAASSDGEGEMPSVANAHSGLATACGLNEPADLSAASDSDDNSDGEGEMPIVANAHSVLATACGLRVERASRSLGLPTQRVPKICLRTQPELSERP